MTLEAVIDGLFAREGDRYGDPTTDPPVDQPTGRGGITLETLRAYVTATGAPLAVAVDTLQTLTHETARAIVAWQVAQFSARTGFDCIAFEPLRLQLVDFAYNSGADRAVRWFQRVLGVPRTGRMDAVTAAAITYHFDGERIPVWIHQALIAARVQMIESAIDSHAIAGLYEHGLVAHRALACSLLEVP